DELRTKPTVLVLEDLHWADESTLDLLRLLGRRVEGLDAPVLVTYRDDELGPAHPLRIVLGDLESTADTLRLRLPSLSAEAVGELAQPHGADAADLYAKTAGNPFFVTEALAGGGEAGPVTVRDAVLRYAPSAGDYASELGASREAAAQYGRALRFSDALGAEARGDLLERRAYACYLVGEFDEALAAQEQALECHRQVGDTRAEGDSLRSLSRLLRYVGR